jgi:hypothetical protein
LLEGGAAAVSNDDEVTGARAVRRLEERIRAPERQLGRKTLEVEILEDALDRARPENRPGSRPRRSGTVADEGGGRCSRGLAFDPARPAEGDDGAASVAPWITVLATAPPTYGCRRVTAVLNRRLRSEGLVPVNHERACRIMQAHSLLLARTCTERPDLAHDGEVIVMRPNLRSPAGLDRWRLAGSLLGRLRGRLARNGDAAGGAFLLGAHDREVIAWRAMANAGIGGSEVRDMMLEAVETCFGAGPAMVAPPRSHVGRKLLLEASDHGASARRDAAGMAAQAGSAVRKRPCP